LVGYVQKREPDAAVAAINAIVSADVADSHVLVNPRVCSATLTTYDASHAPSQPNSTTLDRRHYLIDTRS